MCAEASRFCSRSTAWHSHGRAPHTPFSDLTRSRPIPPQTGHSLMAPKSLAQTGQTRLSAWNVCLCGNSEAMIAVIAYNANAPIFLRFGIGPLQSAEVQVIL